MITEKSLVEHGALTLSSLKTASLFTVKFSSKSALENDVKLWNKKFSQTGVKLKLLKAGESFALIYVYRHDMLESDMANSKASAVLSQYGYKNLSVNLAIERLSQKLAAHEEFPHEIGLFLGYPPEDVEGFICNKGKNCNLCRYWKVYKNTDDAMLKFAKYDKCRAIYKKLWREGRDILKLTVKKKAVA